MDRDIYNWVNSRNIVPLLSKLTDKLSQEHHTAVTQHDVITAALLNLLVLQTTAIMSIYSTTGMSELVSVKSRGQTIQLTFRPTIIIHNKIPNAQNIPRTLKFKDSCSIQSLVSEKKKYTSKS